MHRTIAHVLTSSLADLLRGRRTVARVAKPHFTRRLSLLLITLCAALLAWWCTDHFTAAMIHRGPPPAPAPSAQTLEFTSSVQSSGHWREQSKARQLIDAVPLPREEGDPVALIRAVNQLQLMGKEQAIAALRGYLQTHERSLDESHRLFLIIPVLFPIDERPPVGEFNGQRYLPASEVVLQDDIPFKTSGSYNLQGQQPSPDYLVDWVQSQGVLRAQPLRPSNDPLGAADALYRNLVTAPQLQQLLNRYASYTAAEFKPWLKAYLRWQAWRTVADLVDTQPQWSAPFGEERWHAELLDDAFWQDLKDKATHIRWSAEQLKYVAGGATPAGNE